MARPTTNAPLLPEYPQGGSSSIGQPKVVKTFRVYTLHRGAGGYEDVENVVMYKLDYGVLVLLSYGGIPIKMFSKDNWYKVEVLP